MSANLPAVPAANVQVTRLLQAWQQGDRGAFDDLLAQVHGELRRIAQSRLRGTETPSLAVGDLLNEALLKLIQSPLEWKDRGHFFGSVSLTMRAVLIDHVRARQADKRGGDWQRVTFTLSGSGEEDLTADLLTLDSLLDELEKRDPRAASVLQMTYFAGLEREAIAAVLDVSVPTVDRELRFARAWLARRLDRDELGA